MTHRYFPHTEADIQEMLARCGMKALDELYSDVPEELKLKRPYQLPEEKSEKEVRDFFDALGRKNRTLTCFAGAGYYDHYAPAVIPSLLSRSEFLTAYTPYQPEISQGTLQYIFEYQSMMTQLTGLDVSNASMYDGTTATAEAMLMTVAAARKRNRVLVSATLNPDVRYVVMTYAHYHGVKVDTIAEDNGVTDLKDLEAKLAEGDVAGVILAQPNFYGIVEDFTGVADMIHKAKALMVINAVAADLAVLRTPGEWGADIACGDAQSLGMPLCYGGPYLGYMCTTKALIRKMPGRIVGATTDAEGRRVFVLTLQAREQHIRRDKATSNICSNQGLMALYATIYMGLMGNAGLRDVANQGYAGAHWLAKELEATGKMKLTFPDRPFLNEMVMTTSFPAKALIDEAIEHGILAGVRIADDRLLIAVTEMQTRAQLEKYVEIVKSLKA
ncbi:MAG: aminomethyl-transferring glycine dehydrogenase subunit GcvPA [Bacteroidales bacterium]|nr:aminomethyl-transferring glycine dehydrogenase subunit GcvPA [Bacteroidales bacterium]